jgi:hypothetical protein
LPAKAGLTLFWLSPKEAKAQGRLKALDASLCQASQQAAELTISLLTLEEGNGSNSRRS